MKAEGLADPTTSLVLSAQGRRDGRLPSVSGIDTRQDR